MVKHKDYVLNIEKKKKEKNISLSHQFSLNFFAFVLITIMPNERFLVNTNENIYEIGKKNSLIEWLNFNYVLRGKKRKCFLKLIAVNMKSSSIIIHYLIVTFVVEFYSLKMLKLIKRTLYSTLFFVLSFKRHL